MEQPISLQADTAARERALRQEVARLEQVVALDAERLETIVALHREVEQAEFDVEEVVLRILERARTLLAANAASAGILEGDVIAYKYRTGPGRDSGVLRTPRDASLSGICLKTGESTYCEDSEVDPRVDVAACRAQQLRSMIIVPLRHRGEVVGVLNVNSPEVRAFDANDIRTVELIGGAISAAYGHAADLWAKRALLDELEATVAALKESESKLTHLALHDPLTGLPNRTLFLDRLAVARRQRGEPSVAVLFIDLDGFKLVNDSLGHDAGDALLIDAAARIDGALRGGDTAARFGGDEFAVLCSDASPLDTAVRVAKRLVELLAEPFTIVGRNVSVTASIGIAVDDGSSEDLLRDADTAMYRAKGTHTGGYEVFHPDMHSDAVGRLGLEADLKRAIEHHELVVYYQPIVELGSGGVVAVEALVRWQHPERGLLAPGTFIPLAEETGLIEPLGAWVLGEACRQMAAWHSQLSGGPPLRVSVNVSAQQLASDRVVDDVRRALDDAKLQPQCLVLELTETTIMREVESSLKRLRALKELGVQIAIDDFGTAYSSLRYLQQFPVDALKIAKPFIDGIGKREGDSVMTRAITDLGLNLGLDMIAEGIELTEQLERLRELSCPHGQGYLFSTPLPADEVATLLSGRALVAPANPTGGPIT
jgi:diguanylate cyclase (GGDEF)-like protein